VNLQGSASNIKRSISGEVLEVEGPSGLELGQAKVITIDRTAVKFQINTAA
jgi:hypothetical protein